MSGDRARILGPAPGPTCRTCGRDPARMRSDLVAGQCVVCRVLSEACPLCEDPQSQGRACASCTNEPDERDMPDDQNHDPGHHDYVTQGLTLLTYGTVFLCGWPRCPT